MAHPIKFLWCHGPVIPLQHHHANKGLWNICFRAKLPKCKTTFHICSYHIVQKHIHHKIYNRRNIWEQRSHDLTILDWTSHRFHKKTHSLNSFTAVKSQTDTRCCQIQSAWRHSVLMMPSTCKEKCSPTRLPLAPHSQKKQMPSLEQTVNDRRQSELPSRISTALRLPSCHSLTAHAMAAAATFTEMRIQVWHVDNFIKMIKLVTVQLEVQFIFQPQRNLFQHLAKNY